MDARRTASFAIALACFSGAVAETTRAQSEAPSLQAAIEEYLDADDAAAPVYFRALLARTDATDAALLAALTEEPPSPVPARFAEVVPHAGELLTATYVGPAGRDKNGPRLPVVFDVSGGAFAAHFGPPDGWIVASVSGYTPPQFSDTGRDGFLKILRRAAWRMRGDPDRLYLAGFSWAAHASYDTALHRPRFLRGIVTGGGGPRRTHFRLFRNFVGLSALSFCGEKDDPELVWNLKETRIVAAKNLFDVDLRLDPDAGHDFPTKGAERVPVALRETVAFDDATVRKVRSTPIYADAPFVEAPWIRVDDVDPKRVAIPDRVPVDPSTSYDEQRRRTVRAYEKAVVKVDCAWTIVGEAGTPGAKTVLELKADGVRAATVFLRAPFTEPGRLTTVRAKGADLLSGPLTIDRQALLREARRGGDRLRPVLRAVSATF